MPAFKTLLLACLLAFALVPTAALAEIKGPNGQACNSSESNVKHDIKGKSYSCDKCVILSCSAGGDQLENCTSTTHWSNCVAAFVKPGGAGQVQTEAGQSLAPIAEPPERGLAAPVEPQAKGR